MPSPDDLLLGDYLDDWRERRRSQLRPTTLRGYRQAISAYLRPQLGDVPTPRSTSPRSSATTRGCWPPAA